MWVAPVFVQSETAILALLFKNKYMFFSVSLVQLNDFNVGSILLAFISINNEDLILEKK